jgi:hypothetical protein
MEENNLDFPGAISIPETNPFKLLQRHFRAARR